MNIQDWCPLGLTGLMSLHPKGLSRVFSSSTSIQLFGAQLSLGSNTHIRTWLLEKPYFWLYVPLLANWSLLFIILPRFVIAFLPRSNHLLISWLQSLYTVILEPRKMKSVNISTFYPSICHEVMGLDTIILFSFLSVEFKPTFSLSSHFHQEAL